MTKFLNYESWLEIQNNQYVIGSLQKKAWQIWLHLNYEINWKAFLWYMTQYITIIDYDESSFVIEIHSEKQREWFYKKVIVIDGIH